MYGSSASTIIVFSSVTFMCVSWIYRMPGRTGHMHTNPMCDDARIRNGLRGGTRALAGLISQVRSGVILGLTTCLGAGCVYLPQAADDNQTFAIAPQDGDRISKATAIVDGSVRARLIEDPAEALTSRVALVRAADRSIDAQYYTWMRDVSGHLMIREMVAAADRGVRVRVLVDDIHMAGLVDRVQAIDEHPNIEIRIFNPFSVRLRYDLGLFRLLELAIDGGRLNHRMHNKALISDNRLAILGGRNIGNAYFGLAEDLNFLDTDVLVNGQIVRELSVGFDVYWNSRWAYPVDAFITVLQPGLEGIRRTIDASIAKHAERLPSEADIDWRALVQRLSASSAVSEFAVIYDAPDVRWFDRPDEMADHLIESAQNVQGEILIASPYLIPTKRLLATADQLGGRGVQFKVVTNSLGSNDLVMAHAGYARFRDELLAQGAQLYELRGDALVGRAGQSAPSRRQSFHSKYMVFDDELVYVGSMNLDPRSVAINTELGVVLRSRQLAGELRSSFETLLHPDNSWRVEKADGGFTWTSSRGTTHREPASAWRRFLSFWLSLLPLSGQL